jgi:hypothetical protein
MIIHLSTTKLASARFGETFGCTDIHAKLNHFSIKQARWPSGLRRQLKVLPIRWSERAWVQIPLSSISFCSFYVHHRYLKKMVEWVKNQLFEDLGMRFCGRTFFVRDAWLEAWLNLCTCIDNPYAQILAQMNTVIQDTHSMLASQ